MRYAIIFTLLFAVSACNYDEPNDPNFFTEGTYQAYINTAAFQTAMMSSDITRITAVWTEQMDVVERINIGGLRPPLGMAPENFNEIWDNLYNLGYSSALNGESLAVEAQNDLGTGVAKIMRAYYIAETALLFGDVPFNQVGDFLTFPNPEYDPQEEILYTAIRLLDEGVDLVQGSPITTLNSVFVGSGEWQSFAKALKARYRLALGEYEAALVAAQQAAINTIDQEVRILHEDEEGKQNLFYNFDQNLRRGVLFMDENFFAKRLGANPEEGRADHKTTDTTRFFHFMIDHTSGLPGYELNTNPGGYFAATADFVLIGVPEVQLIIAECAARLNQRALAIDALNVARNYWDDRLEVNDYIDYEDGDAAVANDQLLKTILEEKYLSIIGLVPFYDIARTDNLIGVTLEDERVPERFLYPQTELDRNTSVPGPFGVYEPTPINF